MLTLLLLGTAKEMPVCLFSSWAKCTKSSEVQRVLFKTSDICCHFIVRCKYFFPNDCFLKSAIGNAV